MADQQLKGRAFPVFPTEMTGAQWQEYFWNKDILPWASETNPEVFLVKHFDEYAAKGRPNLKVFFPMCGFTPDMKWTAEQGHNVIGCEYAEKAGPTFAKNSNYTFSTKDLPEVDGKLLSFNEKNLKIYNCDIFKFNKELEGQFDIIWDSGAFVAVNQKEKQVYADLIKSLLKPDGKLLLFAFTYPEGAMAGPPFPCTEQHLEQYFGEMTKTKIDSRESAEEFDEVTIPFTETLYLLTFR